MASKFDGDVRPLSNDARYMGVVFSGSMKSAIRQAKAAKDHGLSEQFVPKGMTRNRAALLEHLNLLRAKPALGVDVVRMPSKWVTPAGFYTVAYAIKRGWIVPVRA
jgi:hypothetical protein